MTAAASVYPTFRLLGHEGPHKVCGEHSEVSMQVMMFKTISRARVPAFHWPSGKIAGQGEARPSNIAHNSQFIVV
eukprot:scaffold198589_cov37-Prasinocladus_malaysianus.AAC.1